MSGERLEGVLVRSVSGHFDMCLRLVIKGGAIELTGLDKVLESAHGYVGFLSDTSGHSLAGSRVSLTKHDNTASVGLKI